MKAFNSTLQWHTAELPPSRQPVLVLTASDQVGEAYHTGNHWLFSDASQSPEVVAWACLPVAEEIRELSAWFHALHS